MHITHDKVTFHLKSNVLQNFLFTVGLCPPKLSVSKIILIISLKSTNDLGEIIFSSLKNNVYIIVPSSSNLTEQSKVQSLKTKRYYPPSFILNVLQHSLVLLRTSNLS